MFPSLSAGVTWLGGDGDLGSADPDTGHVISHTPVGAARGCDTAGYVDGTSSVHGRLHALYRGVDAGPQHAVIEMTPPTVCGLH